MSKIIVNLGYDKVSVKDKEEKKSLKNKKTDNNGGK